MTHLLHRIPTSFVWEHWLMVGEEGHRESEDSLPMHWTPLSTTGLPEDPECGTELTVAILDISGPIQV